MYNACVADHRDEETVQRVRTGDEVACDESGIAFREVSPPDDVFVEFATCAEREDEVELRTHLNQTSKKTDVR